MVVYNDFDSLIDAIKDDINTVAYETSLKMLESMKKVIQEVVYDPYDPVSYIRRGENGGFLGSWKDDPSYDSLGNIIVKLYSDGSDGVMELNPIAHVHGKNGKNGVVDRRDKMDEYIATGKKYDFFVVKGTAQHINRGFGDKDNWWTRPRDYFGEFNDRMGAGDEFLWILSDEFSKANLKIRTKR